MSGPIDPPVAAGPLGDELPAYVANGIVGLRVRDLPLTPGMALLAGFSGDHPKRQIECAASTPYPLAGDLVVNGITLSQAQQQVRIIDQAYDFSCGELTTRLEFEAAGVTSRLKVLTFCSHETPSIVCQEVELTVTGSAHVELVASIDATGVAGTLQRMQRDTPGEPEPACDGVLLWESLGARGLCGIAYATELLGADATPDRPVWREQRMITSWAFETRPGQTYRLRTLVALVPSVAHPRPDEQAVRLIGLSRRQGFERVRAANRDTWKELWRGRVILNGAAERWQALADAAVFYLLTSTHPASPASTSIFGLATWRNYHYYYGHVMWDAETFCVPPLTLLEPDAARSLLSYRVRSLAAAEANARMRGRQGVQFPWESAPSTGHEAAPMPGQASWHEDHVSPDVARAFAFFAAVTGDERFRREKAWPVLSGVAEWLAQRVKPTDRGYEILESMGIAEREQAADNPAYMNLVSAQALHDAVSTAAALGVGAPAHWADIANRLVLPMRDGGLISHDGYRINETKGATPDPLMGVFPLPDRFAPEVRQATLERYLALADDYFGSPMLSALYPTWAARAGDRRLSARMLEEGYGKFMQGRFLQTLEYRPDRFPEQPKAGPFQANIGAFLSTLLLGLPGLEPHDRPPQEWARHKVILPAGWSSIEVERVWIRGEPMRLCAQQGADRAELIPGR